MTPEEHAVGSQIRRDYAALTLKQMAYSDHLRSEKADILRGIEEGTLYFESGLQLWEEAQSRTRNELSDCAREGEELSVRRARFYSALHAKHGST